MVDPANPDELIEAITAAMGTGSRRARNSLVETFNFDRFRARVSHWMNEQTELAVT
jgi:hypothetical protein